MLEDRHVGGHLRTGQDTDGQVRGLPVCSQTEWHLSPRNITSLQKREAILTAQYNRTSWTKNWKNLRSATTDDISYFSPSGGDLTFPLYWASY